LKPVTRRSAAFTLVAFATVPLARAQSTTWPTKPIRIIVPAPPGGAYDRTIRPLAQEMAAQLKQPVVIENKPGAGNIIGTQAGAAAAPDGYTLTMTGMLNTIAQGIYERVPFDIVADFAHIACIGGGEQWLVVNSQAGIGSFAELIDQARREPGKLNYATSGQGSTGHLVMELLQRATATQLTHVPYKGGAPALQDVLAGLVPITVIPDSGAIAHVRSGKLKVLAVSSAARSPDLPQVPTFEELGYKQLTVVSWVGLSAPKGTPPAIVDNLYAAVRASMANKDLMAKLTAEGLTPMLMPPVQYTQLVRSDTERWGQLTRSLNLKAN
jgi:tripartite-type tricarboxylate transporter receptor subunit TctC